MQRCPKAGRRPAVQNRNAPLLMVFKTGERPPPPPPGGLHAEILTATGAVESVSSSVTSAMMECGRARLFFRSPRPGPPTTLRSCQLVHGCFHRSRCVGIPAVLAGSAPILRPQRDPRSRGPPPPYPSGRVEGGPEGTGMAVMEPFLLSVMSIAGVVYEAAKTAAANVQLFATLSQQSFTARAAAGAPPVTQPQSEAPPQGSAQGGCTGFGGGVSRGWSRPPSNSPPPPKHQPPPSM